MSSCVMAVITKKGQHWDRYNCLKPESSHRFIAFDLGLKLLKTITPIWAIDERVFT